MVVISTIGGKIGLNERNFQQGKSTLLQVNPIHLPYESTANNITQALYEPIKVFNIL